MLEKTKILPQIVINIALQNNRVQKLIATLASRVGSSLMAILRHFELYFLGFSELAVRWLPGCVCLSLKMLQMKMSLASLVLPYSEMYVCTLLATPLSAFSKP